MTGEEDDLPQSEATGSEREAPAPPRAWAPEEPGGEEEPGQEDDPLDDPLGEEERASPPDERPSSMPPPHDERRSYPPPGTPHESRRKRLERVLPDLVKRALEKGLEAGIGTLANGGEAIRGVVGRGVVGGVELPKEVAGYVLSQVDETKNAMVRVVAREVREFLEAADLAKELQRALTSLSFEIRTEIRFIPNEAGGITPDVKAEVGPAAPKEAKRRRGLRRPSSTEG